MEEEILKKKDQLDRIDKQRKEALFTARQYLLKANRYGFTQTHLARLWKTNPTRMKLMLAQAISEEND